MRNAPEWVMVGIIRGAHGKQGELMVQLHSDNPERFSDGSELYIEREPDGAIEAVRVGASRQTGEGLLLKLEGFDSRDEAGGIRGARLLIRSSQLSLPEEGSYYGFQLAGCRVYDGERLLGTVQDLKDGKANPYLEIEPEDGSKLLLIPFVKEVVIKVDLEQQRLDIVPGFLG